MGGPTNVDLGALSSGLAVKDAPQLFRSKSVTDKEGNKRVSVKKESIDENKAPISSVNESEATAAVATGKARLPSVAEVRRSILAGVVPLGGAGATRASFLASAATVAPVVEEVVKPETIVRQQALEKVFFLFFSTISDFLRIIYVLGLHICSGQVRR